MLVSYLCTIFTYIKYTHIKAFVGSENRGVGKMKKVLPVTVSYSVAIVKMLQNDEKIVAEIFGAYVVKHYFCIRIRERTLVFK